MRRHKILLMVCILAGMLFGLARAAPDVPVINWSVLSGGGGLLQAGSVQLQSSVGQPVVGLGSSDVVELCSGYLCAPWSPPLTMPLVFR